MRKNSEKRNKLRIACLLLALLMLAAALSGCGKRRGRDPDATPEPTLSPAPSDEPIQGGILRLPMPVNAPYDDPLNVNTEEMLSLFSLVYDTLLKVAPNGEIEPCLCESWTSDGSGAWLLHLREGVKWHDGSGELRAQDVLDTYFALSAMEGGYYKPCLSHITAMEAVDGLTVRVRFNIPGLIALYSLVFPIRRSAELMGTGAYRLERKTDNSVTLCVNPDWWDKIPMIEKVIFEERDSNTTALASYEASQLNFVPTDIITAGKYSESGVTKVHDVMTQSMEVLLFNSTSDAFSDVRIRLAAAHAINRSRIITNVYSNRARAADVPIPPDSWLYDSRCAVLNYDPELSSSLIEEAGYTVVSKEGLRYKSAGGHLAVKLLTSATTENTVRSDAASMIASQLNELGFSVEVITKAHTLGDPESDFIKALREGGWDMALVGFNLGLSNELTSYIEANGANNFGHMANAELAEKARAMCSAATEEELREAAYSFQSAFVENVPFLTMYFRLNSIICAESAVGPENAREPYIFADIKNWYFSKQTK